MANFRLIGPEAMTGEEHVEKYEAAKDSAALEPRSRPCERAGIAEARWKKKDNKEANMPTCESAYSVCLMKLTKCFANSEATNARNLRQ